MDVLELNERVVDPVADAARIMRRQNSEILRLRVQLMRARSLLRQGRVYTRQAMRRWEAAGLPTTPASDVDADIERFLEETKP